MLESQNFLGIIIVFPKKVGFPKLDKKIGAEEVREHSVTALEAGKSSFPYVAKAPSLSIVDVSKWHCEECIIFVIVN